MAPVQWPDAVDEVIGGDLTAALAYVTPAGGAVVTAVAPIGLRDRDAGTVSFTTSLGFGRKLERIERDPRVALAYHAREHGLSQSPRYVLVQGSASVVKQPDQEYVEFIGGQATPFMGPPRRGVFWDRWLSAYYSDRVPVHVQVERIVSWPDLRCAGEPEVHGSAPPADPPRPRAGAGAGGADGGLPRPPRRGEPRGPRPRAPRRPAAASGAARQGHGTTARLRARRHGGVEAAAPARGLPRRRRPPGR